MWRSSEFCFIDYWPDTDEELIEWKTKFQERIALLSKKITKLEREEEDTTTKALSLKERIDEYIWEISKLQKEADVHLTLITILLQ